MGKSHSYDESGLKKGPWTPEEDQKLVQYIEEHGHGSWRALPKLAGLHRCGKSCRLRWTNYLRPDIKRGNFSPEEEQTILHLHSLLGNKWSTIATHLNGRTDNEIKNFWNTHLKNKLIHMGIDPMTHQPRTDLYSNLHDLLPMQYQSLDQHATTSLHDAAEAVAQLVKLQYLHQQYMLQSHLLNPNSNYAPPIDPMKENPNVLTSSSSQLVHETPSSFSQPLHETLAPHHQVTPQVPFTTLDPMVSNNLSQEEEKNACDELVYEYSPSFLHEYSSNIIPTPLADDHAIQNPGEASCSNSSNNGGIRSSPSSSYWSELLFEDTKPMFEG